VSPRRSVADTLETRQRILERSLAIASAEGLEGLTIGRLADELGMSKAGLLGHFGTKEGLQLAVVDEAAAVFSREVPQRVKQLPSGLPRLKAVCEAWVSYLEREVLPGGCFFTAATTEFDGRSGRVRDALAGMNALWRRDLRIHIRRAISDGDLARDADVDQLIYEIVGIMLALNHFLQLEHDAAAPARARKALDRLFRGTPYVK